MMFLCAEIEGKIFHGKEHCYSEHTRSPLDWRHSFPTTGGRGVGDGCLGFALKRNHVSPGS